MSAKGAHMILQQERLVILVH